MKIKFKEIHFLNLLFLTVMALLAANYARAESNVKCTWKYNWEFLPIDPDTGIVDRTGKIPDCSKIKQQSDKSQSELNEEKARVKRESETVKKVAQPVTPQECAQAVITVTDKVLMYYLQGYSRQEIADKFILLHNSNNEAIEKIVIPSATYLFNNRPSGGYVTSDYNKYNQVFIKRFCQ